jgi:tetratricopeptide (TPR) repeat protein
MVPLVHRTVEGAKGRVYDWWEYDPDHHPSLPHGAVRGDPHRQVYCAGHHVPKYFHVDEEQSCVQCGREFTFGAEEQKYWYEVRQFNFGSVPVRCLSCRRQRRTEHALRERIALARRMVDGDPRDPAAHLALAEAIVTYHERTDAGDLNQAVAAARRAAELWPECLEAAYWEGAAQARAGHRRRAAERLQAFLDASGSRPRSLESRAEAYLSALG